VKIFTCKLQVQPEPDQVRIQSAFITGQHKV